MGPVVDVDGVADAVSEDALNGDTVGITASALDGDVTTSAITYSLDDDAGGRFGIDTLTGVVTVADASLLDRETAASHAITVRATSADGSSEVGVYSIAIGDVDEFPVSGPLDIDPGADAVSENATSGTAVGLVVLAADADATNNAVSYSLDDDAGGRFAIDAVSGVVTVANGLLLDREAAPSHDIVVRAQSSDGSSSVALFTISIDDVDEYDVTAG